MTNKLYHDIKAYLNKHNDLFGILGGGVSHVMTLINHWHVLRCSCSLFKTGLLHSCRTTYPDFMECEVIIRLFPPLFFFIFQKKKVKNAPKTVFQSCRTIYSVIYWANNWERCNWHVEMECREAQCRHFKWSKACVGFPSLATAKSFLIVPRI